MTEKPILFSTEMVKAILEGCKTQTRRVIKPQPEFTGVDTWIFNDEIFVSDAELQDHLFHNVYGVKGSPYGSIYGDGSSDTLWVRETWATSLHFGNVKPSDLPIGGCPIYYWDDDFGGYKKRPSIFMPRWASRLTLQIEDVRVEQAQDISPKDCFAEGIIPKIIQQPIDPIGEFYKLWDSFNAKRGYSWESNPWVWVVEFSIQEKFNELAK